MRDDEGERLNATNSSVEMPAGFGASSMPLRPLFTVTGSTRAIEPTACLRPTGPLDPTFGATAGLEGQMGPQLYIAPAAMREIAKHIEWGIDTDENRVEQGGLLLGVPYHDPESGTVWSKVVCTVPATLGQGSGTYLLLDHRAWKAMLDRIDSAEDGCADVAGLSVVGWYHTHPGGLGVFMSGTDRGTQRHFFAEAWQFAIVLNPHRQIWGAFNGSEAAECTAVVLSEATE